MMKIRLLFVSICLFANTYADEGLWIPLLIQQQVLPAMQQAGCKLTAEQIYSAQNACLTNAIVKVGGGCTGGIISNQGLIITNYHCVEYFISKISTVENNYLNKGFWAQSSAQEIPVSDVPISVLFEIIDVTDSIQSKLHTNISFAQQQKQIDSICDSIVARMQLNSPYLYSIEPFYSGNQYFMFKTLKYTDVRFVGFPSVQMGQFGGETDNWVWPRESADFALLRVYADSSNLPRKFNSNNIPYIPKKSLDINAKGVKEGDFTMVMGYPANTMNYVTSQELQIIHDSLNPRQITMREIRLRPIESYMATNDAAYIQYYGTYAKLVNYYKKWKGEQYGIENSQAITNITNKEKEIIDWINSNDSLKILYGSLFEQYNQINSQYIQYQTALILYLEGLWRMDYMTHAQTYFKMYGMSPKLSVAEDLVKRQTYARNYFNTKNIAIENQSLPEMQEYILKELPSNLTLDMFHNTTIEQRRMMYSNITTKSIIQDSVLSQKFFKKASKKRHANPTYVGEILDKDYGFIYAKNLYNFLNTTMYPLYFEYAEKNDSIQKVMMKVQLLYHTKSAIHSNANSTLRVSFGNVRGYTQVDGLYKKPYTIETDMYKKIQTKNTDYKEDKELLLLLRTKNFGSYSKDSLFLNFAATNQTSGGSSGSPVLDANGRMIGLNFDRNLEGTMGDYYFDTTFCRNISVDIRYILFCIEMYGKVPYLLHEMNIISQ